MAQGSSFKSQPLPHCFTHQPFTLLFFRYWRDVLTMVSPDMLISHLPLNRLCWFCFWSLSQMHSIPGMLLFSQPSWICLTFKAYKKIIAGSFLYKLGFRSVTSNRNCLFPSTIQCNWVWKLCFASYYQLLKEVSICEVSGSFLWSQHSSRNMN